MAPTASQTSSKPPAYPKNAEPAPQRASSKTRSRDPVRKTEADPEVRKRSKSEVVPNGNRNRSRSSAKSVSSSPGSVLVRPAIELKEHYVRTAQRDNNQSHDTLRYQNNARPSGKSGSRGRTTGPLKAFPHSGLTNANAPSGKGSPEYSSTENLQVDLSGASSPLESPTPKNGRRCSSSDKSSASRPLPVFIKPDASTSNLQTHNSDKTVGSGSASKRRVGSHGDLTSKRNESETPKLDRERRKTSSKSSDDENRDINKTFERISLESAPRNSKPRTGSKAELPEVEVRGNSVVKPELSESDKRKGSYQKFTEKSVRLGVNGGSEVLGGRSHDILPQGFEGSIGVKSRSRILSNDSTKDLANHSVSSRPSKSDFRTETFVFNVDRNLESERDDEDRIPKTNNYSTTKPSLSPTSGNGKSGKAGVVGLQNLGNTCFMNSVLQCLSNTRLLLDYCLDGRYERDINRSSSSMKGKMINVYADLMIAMWRGIQSSISPSEFKSEISSFAKQFVGYREQDAHEFLVYLLEALHEDVNRVREKRRRIIDSADEVEKISAAEKARISWKNYLACDDSQINDIFVGQLKSTLRCPDCSYVSNTFEPFLALSLPLRKVKTRMSLIDCFKLFSQKEILDQENQPRCAKCRMQTSCTKQMSIHRFPKVLIIHLMRFKQGSSTKLTTEVACPLRDLDLSEFATEESSPESSAAPPVYSLFAVSNHSGSLYSGHYTAYAKNPDTDQWYHFNDRIATSVALPRLESGQPYLLFYERQDQETT